MQLSATGTNIEVEILKKNMTICIEAGLCKLKTYQTKPRTAPDACPGIDGPTSAAVPVDD